MELKPGQVVEFFRPVEVEGRRIEKGTRARIAHVIAELVEPTVVLILLDREKPEALTVPRHVVTVNSITLPG